MIKAFLRRAFPGRKKHTRQREKGPGENVPKTLTYHQEVHCEEKVGSPIGVVNGHHLFYGSGPCC
jgi:hypothetical protein